MTKRLTINEAMTTQNAMATIRPLVVKWLSSFMQISPPALFVVQSIPAAQDVLLVVVAEQVFAPPEEALVQVLVDTVLVVLQVFVLEELVVVLEVVEELDESVEDVADAVDVVDVAVLDVAVADAEAVVVEEAVVDVEEAVVVVPLVVVALVDVVSLVVVVVALFFNSPSPSSQPEDD
jgi:hypothetical protein